MMGADAFVAFFGIKVTLDPQDEDTLDACGMETDPRCVAAKKAGLETHSGRMTDGEDYFLLIGQRLGLLGLEYEPHVKVAPDRLAALISDVQARLKQAGFNETPALHLQFEAQY
jgi:hypothetical protein